MQFLWKGSAYLEGECDEKEWWAREESQTYLSWKHRVSGGYVHVVVVLPSRRESAVQTKKVRENLQNK